MLADRPKIEQAAHAVFSREGFAVRRVPSEHAGGKWRLSYPSFTGQPANLDVDFNFMYRQPLWEIHHADSHPLGEFQAKGIPVLDLHELAAGKLSALFSRRQARDLFDCHRVLDTDEHQPEWLRIAFVAYGVINRKDWRTVSVDGLRQHGIGEATRPRPSHPPTARAGDIAGVRGASCRRVQEGAFHRAPIHRRRARIPGPAAGPRGSRRIDLDVRHDPAGTHPGPAAARVEGAQCAAAQGTILNLDACRSTDGGAAKQPHQAE